MPTAAKKRQPKPVNDIKYEKEISQPEPNYHGDIEISDLGDNHFRPGAGQHGKHEIDTNKGGRPEGERENQGHKSEPEHNVPAKRDETVED